jgi:S1-C subfamily serine protease
VQFSQRNISFSHKHAAGSLRYPLLLLVAGFLGITSSISHATALFDSKGTSASCVGIGPIVSDCVKMAEQSGLIQTKNLGFTGITFGKSGDSDGLITKIEPGSPAAQAGLQIGDAIAAVNGNPVQLTPGSIAEERTFGARGENLQLKVQRGSSALSITFIRAAKDAPPDPKSISKLIYVRAVINWKGQFVPCMGAGPAGLAAIAICQSTFKKDGYIKTSDFGSTGLQLDLTRSDNALITEVDPGSPAATAGLQTGDLILQVNGQPLSQSLGENLQDMLFGKIGDQFQVTVKSGGNSKTVQLALGAKPK